MATTEVITRPAIIPPTDIHPADWHEQRKLYIGASECSAMFADPALASFGQDGIVYGCARRLFYDKTDTPIDFPRTPEEEEILLRGTELEDLVVEKFQREVGFKVRRQQTRISRTHPHVGVNMDRQIIGARPEQMVDVFGREDAAKGAGVLECKTANEFVFKKIEAKEGVPYEYVLQLQHAMAVTGYEWGIFAVLGYGPRLWRLTWFGMLRDEKLCQVILNRAEQVWAGIEQLSPPNPLPQPDKRCGSCVYRRTCLGSAFMPAASDGNYEVDESLHELTADYLAAKEEEEKFHGVTETIKTQLKDRLGDRSRVEVPSLNARIRFIESVQQRVDSKGLQSKFPDVYMACTKPVKSRALYVETV